MKVYNTGENIVIDANFDEMSKIVYALDQFIKMNPDETEIKELAEQIHSPKII
ncbi:hypothetical protein [Lentibacillus amyloliquefaciens]|uniref:hypothetical protein n=1 Tax=Lentibacillus amyloliquefaciens TaxID=1472767 RepID=UPI0012E3A1CB|nr:hypothetical protein [Lentibacillus amyloliquefaciens]